MEHIDWGLYGVAFSILVFTIRTIFKGPKEISAESDRRLLLLEANYSTLALRVEGTHGRHEEALENLTNAVERLTGRLDRWMENGNGGSGRRTQAK
jgi:hypothetical protein